MTVERDSLLNQVQRLRGAEEDLLQQQVTLLSQLQCKDEELLHKSEELIKYKTRWTELDHKVPIIDSELAVFIDEINLNLNPKFNTIWNLKLNR